MADFGPSELGRHPGDVGFVGRRVDLIGRSLPVSAEVDPERAVRDYLGSGGSTSAHMLAGKAVVGVDPPELRGKTIWPY